jgi:hypothetical protein
MLRSAILMVPLTLMVGCALFNPDKESPEEGDFIWNGLQVESREWASEVGQGEKVLRHISYEGCFLEMIRGGSDVPPDWSVAKSRTTLGEIGYEVFEVSSPEGIQYVNYFYRPGEEFVNIGGFRVRPGPDPVHCIEAAEALFSTLNPEGLRLRTPTPAG